MLKITIKVPLNIVAFSTNSLTLLYALSLRFFLRRLQYLSLLAQLQVINHLPYQQTIIQLLQVNKENNKFNFFLHGPQEELKRYYGS